MELYTDIAELLTLEGATQKHARGTVESDLGLIRNAALVTHKGKILWAGSKNKIPRQFKKSKAYHLRGMTVLPAFIESHTHLIFAGDRSHEFEMRIQGATYQDIAQAGGGIRHTVDSTRKSSASALRKIAQKRVEAFLKQGVTTIESKSGYGLNLRTEKMILEVSKKLQKARIITTYLGPHALPPEHADSGSYMKEVIEKHLPAIKKLTTRADIFIEKGYFSISEAEAYIKAIKGMGWDLVVHADQLSHSGGTELAVRMGARSVDHLLEASDSDLRSLASSETTAVLLPAADLYLKTKYPQARKLLDMGGRVALSTDFNPGSSPTQDISLIGVLARLEMKMTLPEVIVAYTLGAAYAINKQEELGSLVPGKSADFITIEGSYRQLFYQIGHHPVQKVWREGKNLKIS